MIAAMHAERSIRTLTEKLRDIFVNTFVVPWNKCDRAREIHFVHFGYQFSVIQISIGALERRIINDEVAKAVFVVPALAVKNRPEKYRRRK